MGRSTYELARRKLVAFDQSHPTLSVQQRLARYDVERPKDWITVREHKEWERAVLDHRRQIAKLNAFSNDLRFNPLEVS